MTAPTARTRTPVRKPTRTELENSLEAYFYKSIREKLGAHLLKLVPVEKGTPDRLVLLPYGRSAFVELKVTGGAVEPRQALFAQRISHLGHVVHVLTDRVEVDAWIRHQAQQYDVAALKAAKQYRADRKKSVRGAARA